jgi:hypothetical protein
MSQKSACGYGSSRSRGRHRICCASIRDRTERSRGARTPRLSIRSTLRKSKRAQGMPGAGRYPWPACRKKSRRQSPQVQPTSGIPCAMVYNLYEVSPGTGLFAPVISVMRSIIADLALAPERQDPTTSPSVSSAIVVAPSTSTAPRLALRDDRPKRPSSSRRDARKHRLDLPDDTSAATCDELARRAICAWRAYGICPSGNHRRYRCACCPGDVRAKADFHQHASELQATGPDYHSTNGSSIFVRCM